MVKELFKIGTETVKEIDGQLYVAGIGYQFSVLITEEYFMTSGKIRKETENFLREFLALPEIMES